MILKISLYITLDRQIPHHHHRNLELSSQENKDLFFDIDIEGVGN